MTCVGAGVLCPRCGQPVTLALLYNGKSLRFNIEPRDPHPDGHYPAERWFAIRGRGMTPESLLNESEITGRQYLTLHACVSRVSKRDEQEARTLIAARSGSPLTGEMQLDSRYEYTYRWPSSWAHILGEYQYVALCGVRMPEGRRTATRERERLRSMRVCPNCCEVLGAPVGRGRQLYNDVLGEMLAKARKSKGIDPSLLGAYVRRQLGSAGRQAWQMPVHKVGCSELEGVQFNSLEWTGFDVMPSDAEACPVCKPRRPLSELAVEAELARGLRRKVRILFGPLGPYVHRGGIVHRHDCPILADYADTTGWQGTKSTDGLEPCARCEPHLLPLR